jgi:diguanylate cyclase (GGDEF)-like protein
VEWSKLPDLLAVGLLTSAFASVARRGQWSLSGLWLTGWVMIVLHFAATLFENMPGHWGDLAEFICLASLVWGGLLFMCAAVPYRTRTSSTWMLGMLLGTNTLYLGLLIIDPVARWAQTPMAVLMGALPLSITLITLPRFTHPLRWTVAGLYSILAIFLVAFQHRPGNGPTLALNAVFFTVYLGCSIHFWYAYRRATAGAFITIAGFFAWAGVFVAAPFMEAFIPSLHLESEVWNLPKYIVAVGMILLLLESQIEHNKYLALHDELTGLPNRRLFQDRLAIALERARRTGAQTALLVVDLDRFKEVNDSVGHHAGDQLLKCVGDLFQGRVRRSDTVARTGGDEFSLILEEPITREDALSVARSLAQLLETPLVVGGGPVRVGASVGIAIFPEDATDAESLCIAADRRMYEGKHSTKSRDVDQTLRPLPPRSVPAVEPHSGFRTAE